MFLVIHYSATNMREKLTKQGGGKMKATIKNQIRLAIVVACVLLIGFSVAVAEETLLLASLSRTTPLEEFEDFDRFPGYQKEARDVENKNEIKVEIDVLEEIKKADQNDTVDTVASSVAWVGGKAVDSYVILNGDYGKLLTGLLSD
jgi:hypothetical protein